MIRRIADGVRAGLIAAAMTVAIPMFVFAQTAESGTEQMLATGEQDLADADAAGRDDNSTTGTLVQAVTPPKPEISGEVDVEIQSRFNEIRRELLDERANTIDWWLASTAVFLTLFAIAVAVVGFMGFRRFREILKEAQESNKDAAKHAKDASKHAEDAERHLREIEKIRDKSLEILEDMNTQTTDDDPEQASQAVEGVQNNPEASPMDKAVASAVAFQRRGETEKALEKWQAIANITEESDKDLAAKAWFAIGYLIPNESLEKCISAYDESIRLNPGNARTYNNRGNAKARLGDYEAAITDYDEAIRLNPEYAFAHNNRGHAKTRLGDYGAAISDCAEAIRLFPGYALAYYNRGIAWLLRKEYGKAESDLSGAKNREMDIIAAFRSRYKSVADFEKQYGVNVPEGIKKMLQP